MIFCKLDTKRNISDLQKAQTWKSRACQSLSSPGAVWPIGLWDEEATMDRKAEL